MQNNKQQLSKNDQIKLGSILKDIVISEQPNDEVMYDNALKELMGCAFLTDGIDYEEFKLEYSICFLMLSCTNYEEYCELSVDDIGALEYAKTVLSINS